MKCVICAPAITNPPIIKTIMLRLLKFRVPIPCPERKKAIQISVTAMQITRTAPYGIAPYSNIPFFPSVEVNAHKNATNNMRLQPDMENIAAMGASRPLSDQVTIQKVSPSCH